MRPLRPFRGLRPLAAAAVVLAAMPALAASDATPPAERAWRAELDALAFGAMGADRVAGGVATRDESSTPIVESYAPIRLKIDGDGTFRFELTRFQAKRSWGLSAWWYDGGDSDTRLPGITSDSAGGIVRTLYTNNLAPPLVAPDAGAGAASFGGSSHMSMGSFQLYAVLPVGARRLVELRLGLRLAKMTEKRDENAGRVDGPASEQYRLDSQASTRLLVGPSVGARARGRLGKSTFTGWADLGVVFGDTEYDLAYDVTMSGRTPVQVQLTDRGRTVIPSIELGARWSYAIGPRWGLGLAVFSSIWLDAPTAPFPAAATPSGSNVSVGPMVFVDDTFTGTGVGLTASWTDRPKRR